MHIRPTTRRDLSRITEIASTAFLDSEMSQYLNPDRHKYPAAWYRLCREATKRRFVKPNTCGVVCVEPAASASLDGTGAKSGEERILGYAWWTRVGLPEDEPWSVNSNANNSSLAAAVERALLSVESAYESVFRPNRAVNVERKMQWDRWSNEDDALGPLKGQMHWWLDSIAVASEARKRGVGSALVQWGMEQLAVATASGTGTGTKIPIVLIATPEGSAMYKKLGFKVVVWVGRNFVDLMGFEVRGGEVFVWDPEERLVRDAPAGARDQGGKRVDAVWTDGALRAAGLLKP